MNVTVQIDSPGKQNWIGYLYLAAIVGDYKDNNPKDPILVWDGFISGYFCYSPLSSTFKDLIWFTCRYCESQQG